MEKAEVLPGAAVARKQRGPIARFFYRLVKEKPLGTVGAALVLLLFFAGIFANLIAPYGYTEIHMKDYLAPPSSRYILGADTIGRDNLSRIIYGARVSMVVGLSASTIAVFLGAILGITSGFLGGKFDLFFQRFVDAWLCFPGLVIYLTLMSIIGGGQLQLILAVGIGGAIGGSRLYRSATIALKGNVWINAAQAMGARTGRVVFRHLLPNIIPIMIIAFTLGMGGVILTEASLSFLGFGIPPPVPSWGGMLSGSRGIMQEAPWLALWPGVALTLAVYGINMFGDALRDLLDPRLRGGIGGMGAYGTERAKRALEKKERQAQKMQLTK